MWTRVVALFGILGVVPVLAFLPWDDPCYITPNRYPKTGQVEKIEFTHECSKGEIRWDYPQGTLMIHFLPPNKAPFKLCLKSTFASFIEHIYSVVNGQRIPVKAPKEGNDSCVPSLNGELQLELVAPPVMYYMTSMEFYTTLS